MTRRPVGSTASSAGYGDGGGTLILRGEPGIGKTAVLAEAAAFARASGLRVLHTASVEIEAHLPYAGLHQLLRPVRDHFGVLPPSQRVALQAALGLIEGTDPAGYLVALAVLNLLAEVATAAPVLVVAEDTHWLDPSTGDVLAFVGRRLASEPILLLASVRNGFPSRLDQAALPDLVVAPLSAQSAAELLDTTAADLPAAVRGRLLTEAAGNPLALIELPAAIRASGDAASLASPWLPLTARLENAFTRRFSELPPATAATLAVATLNDRTDLAETLAAASQLAGRPVSVADLRPAVRARLIGLGDSDLTFHHPLVRSAIHQAIGAERRRDGHRALADVLKDQPDRRTWHLAAASEGPDENIAAALEAVAVRAQARGSGATVVAALERAAWLSPLADQQADRLLRAADAAVEQSGASLAGLRDQGRLQLLARALAAQAWAAAQLADLMVAMPAAEEAARLARETGQPYLLGIALATLAKVAALRGDFGRVGQLAAEAERIGTPVSARPVLATAQHARALAALGEGDYPQALARLLRMQDMTDPAHQLALSCHTITDLADAASHSDDLGSAAAVIAAMEQAAATTTSPSLHDGLRLARAVLASPEQAGDLFARALAPDLARRPFTRARTQLAYGEWLRRQRRAAESRPHLRAAGRHAKLGATSRVQLHQVLR